MRGGWNQQPLRQFVGRQAHRLQELLPKNLAGMNSPGGVPFRATLIGSSSSVIVRYFDIVSIAITPTKQIRYWSLMRMLYWPCPIALQFFETIAGRRL